MLTTSLQVIYIHQNIPGVLRKGNIYLRRCLVDDMLTLDKVNAILGDHNVDKQISDSKGDVGFLRKLACAIQYD